MPKEKRKRLGAHQPSVKLARRQFAVQEQAVEHLDIGGAVDVPATEILGELSEPEPKLKKKEKQQLKREAFIEHLQAARAPYSKNHARRLKRRAREQIANGMTDLQAAITALDDNAGASNGRPDATGSSVPSKKGSTPAPKLRKKSVTQAASGMIGEGRNATLRISQRKRALELERLRQPLILSNPDFSSNPFQTIRTHASNTLVKYQPPPPVPDKS